MGVWEKAGGCRGGCRSRNGPRAARLVDGNEIYALLLLRMNTSTGIIH